MEAINKINKSYKFKLSAWEILKWGQVIWLGDYKMVPNSTEI